MSEDESYRKLMAHHNTWLFGMPESKYLLPLLKKRLSAEDAEFFIKIPFLPYSAEVLSKKLDMPVDELTEKLEGYAKKGLITSFRSSSSNRSKYALAEIIFMYYRMPGWTGEENEWIEKVSALSNRYYEDIFAESWLKPHTRGLRAIPINETVQDTKEILPYEDVVKYVEDADYWAVSHCACRIRKNRDRDSHNCKHDTLNCLHFNQLGRYTVEYGMGKKITKEETLKILKESADAGLVHGISNSQDGIDTICNCCSDCCLYLEKAVKVLGLKYMGHQHSNYIRMHFDASKCEYCGICAKHCPMEALQLKVNKHPKIIFKADQCIGCGVCVHKCPTGAICMVKRKKPVSVPKNGAEFLIRYATEQGKNPEEMYKKNLIN